MSGPSEYGEDPSSEPEERRAPSGGEERVDQDNLSELRGEEAVDEDERAEDEVLELDQTELDKLGLVLDDPHQPNEE
jgi:hypothetical protein